MREDNGAVGLFPCYFKAKRLRQSAGGDIVGAAEHERLHGIPLCISQIKNFSVQRNLDIPVFDFLLNFAIGSPGAAPKMLYNTTLKVQ